MAGNFWKSSHCEQWILEKFDLLRERGVDLRILTEEEYQKIMIFFCNFITVLGADQNTLPRYRQQVVATACVYFRRFYARRSFKDIDPFLLAPTCVLLASKVDEFGMLSTTKIIRSVPAALKKWPYLNVDVIFRAPQIQEAEFSLLEVMDCCLIVYHPYRPLTQFINDMKSHPGGFKDTDSILSDAWKVCNDSLRTDASLLFAPHIIALAAIMIAALMSNRDRDIRNWLAEFSVDFEKVFEVQQMILNMYKLEHSYKEKDQLEDLLKKMPKPQLTASSSLQPLLNPSMKMEFK